MSRLKSNAWIESALPQQAEVNRRDFLGRVRGNSGPEQVQQTILFLVGSQQKSLTYNPSALAALNSSKMRFSEQQPRVSG
jgi:hypothetical protein